MKKQQVRPRVDKELFDEVIDYCGGGETFCESLKWMIERKKQLGVLLNSSRQEIDKSNKRICELESRLDRAIDIATETVNDYESALCDLDDAQQKGIRYSIITFCCGLVLGLSSAYIYVNYL